MDYKKKWDLEKAKVNAILEPRGIEYPPCGFHVGDGWYPIVEEALDKLIAAGWNKKLDQVKSKFCTLRIYIDYDEAWKDFPARETYLKLNEIIGEAEAKAALACEHCGSPHGLEVPRGGIALCPPCEAKDLAAIKLNSKYKSRPPTE